MSRPAGLVLLTGGRGRRFGGPKHGQPHPAGGSWGGHLVEVFQAVFPDGPVRILGEPLAERPDLAVLADPGQGPAAALRCWAGLESELVRRWWLAPCDQVRWTAPDLAAWAAAAEAADPAAGAWVMARTGDFEQYLGSFMAGSLLGRLAQPGSGRMSGLARALPCVEVDWAHECWKDVDTPAECRHWLKLAD